jgi:hypothetical protein
MKAEPSLNVTKFMPSKKNIIAGMLVSFRMKRSSHVQERTMKQHDKIFFFENMHCMYFIKHSMTKYHCRGEIKDKALASQILPQLTDL